MTQIFVTRVTTPQEKLHAIYSIVQRYFEQGHRILIQVPNDEAAVFMDQFLWKYEEEGFIPHMITKADVKAAVVITTQEKNLNAATVVINLCPHVTSLTPQVEMLFELEDLTHPLKAQLSQERIEVYRSKGFNLHCV